MKNLTTTTIRTATTRTAVILIAGMSLTSCMAQGLHKLGDWMESAERSLFADDEEQASTPQVRSVPTAPVQAVYGPVNGWTPNPEYGTTPAEFTPEQLAQIQAMLQAQALQNGHDAQTGHIVGHAIDSVPESSTDEELEMGELMALIMMLSGDYDEQGQMQLMPDGSMVFAPQPAYGQGYAMQPGYGMQQGYPMQQGYGMQPGYDQTGGWNNQGSYAQGDAGWAGGFSPDVMYDQYEYQNPESSYYDQYEVDSEGWSGGAYENPSSSYYDSSYDSSSSYDTGSFSGGFDY